MAFNNGKPYVGSNEVKDGRLRGTTDSSEHFFFLSSVDT